MRNIFISYILLLGVFSCSEEHKNTNTCKPENLIETKNSGIDSLIHQYLSTNTNRFPDIDGKSISYILDHKIRNNIKYTTVQIGYNFDDRFTTNQLIYIDSINQIIYESDNLNDSLLVWSSDIQKETRLPNGDYRFDIAFAEWEGKSMGEKVTVRIKNDSISVIYEGDGQLNIDKNSLLDKGIILKHKSGEWIIGNNQKDINALDIGGCSDGPSIIDFKNKKFWMC